MPERISSGSPFEGSVGFSRAVRVGQRVIVAGTAPIWPDGSCDASVEAQARRCKGGVVVAKAAGTKAAADELLKLLAELVKLAF